MRSILAATAFLLVVIVFSLIYKLPAKFIYQQFSEASPVRLSGISGSIWSGQAETIDSGEAIFSGLSWQLSPWALLVGDIDVQCMLNDPAIMIEANITISGEQIDMTGIKGHIDLIELGSRFSKQEVLLGGGIDIDIAGLRIENNKLLNIEGSMIWKQAQLFAERNIKLGDFKAEFFSKSGALLTKLSDTGGAVALQSDVMISLQGTYRYDLEVGIRDTSVPGLLDGFSQLGKPDENGKVSLSGNGNLF